MYALCTKKELYSLKYPTAILGALTVFSLLNFYLVA